MPTLQRYKKTVPGPDSLRRPGAQAALSRERAAGFRRDQERKRGPARPSAQGCFRSPSGAGRGEQAASGPSRQGRRSRRRRARPSARGPQGRRPQRGAAAQAAPRHGPPPGRRPRRPPAAAPQDRAGARRSRQSHDAHPDQRADRNFLSHSGALRPHARRSSAARRQGPRAAFLSAGGGRVPPAAQESGRGGRKKGRALARRCRRQAPRRPPGRPPGRPGARRAVRPAVPPDGWPRACRSASSVASDRPLRSAPEGDREVPGEPREEASRISSRACRSSSADRSPRRARVDLKTPADAPGFSFCRRSRDDPSRASGSCRRLPSWRRMTPAARDLSDPAAGESSGGASSAGRVNSST